MSSRACLSIHARSRALLDRSARRILRDAARRAVAAIQARAGTEAGGFALVEEGDSAGALSLGEADARGAVSLRHDPEPRER